MDDTETQITLKDIQNVLKQALAEREPTTAISEIRQDIKDIHEKLATRFKEYDTQYTVDQKDLIEKRMTCQHEIADRFEAIHIDLAEIKAKNLERSRVTLKAWDYVFLSLPIIISILGWLYAINKNTMEIVNAKTKPNTTIRVASTNNNVGLCQPVSPSRENIR